MIRIEYVLGTIFAVVWGFAIVAQEQLLPVASLLDLDLHVLYSVDAGLGWLAGNFYVVRRRKLHGGQRRLLALYALGPLSVPVLLRSLAPIVVQRAAPLVPVYGFIVYLIFFLVPVSLRRD